MAQVTLNPTADTRIIDSSATTNFGTNNILDAGENNSAASVRRAMLKFDFASIPPKSRIVSGTLRLYDNAQNYASNTRLMRVYRLKRAWTENGATWNTYDGTNNWTTAGADNSPLDREATDMGSVSMPATEVLGYVSITMDAAKIQEWIDGEWNNNGILLRMDTETDDQHEFQSREGTNKPELIISFIPPGGGALLLNFI